MLSPSVQLNGYAYAVSGPVTSLLRRGQSENCQMNTIVKEIRKRTLALPFPKQIIHARVMRPENWVYSRLALAYEAIPQFFTSGACVQISHLSYVRPSLTIKKNGIQVPTRHQRRDAHQCDNFPLFHGRLGRIQQNFSFVVFELLLRC